jgi:hypothetical protein
MRMVLNETGRFKTNLRQHILLGHFVDNQHAKQEARSLNDHFTIKFQLYKNGYLGIFKSNRLKNLMR